MTGVPLIGITCSYSENRISLDGDYVSAVERAGGVPIVIPALTSPEAMRIAISKIDALIIPGGPGITEGLIGDLPDDLPPASTERSQSDRFALQSANDDTLPVLGICYGMQLINATHGGTIYADVQRDPGVAAHHPRRMDEESILHDVTVEPDTRLAGLVPTPDPVNSFHVQAVAQLGEGFVLTLTSDDGLIEGFESTDGRIVGIQFHPEKLPGSVWDNLFLDLVKRATARRTEVSRSPIPPISRSAS